MRVLGVSEKIEKKLFLKKKWKKWMKIEGEEKMCMLIRWIWCQTIFALIWILVNRVFMHREKKKKRKKSPGRDAINHVFQGKNFILFIFPFLYYFDVEMCVWCKILYGSWSNIIFYKWNKFANLNLNYPTDEDKFSK